MQSKPYGYQEIEVKWRENFRQGADGQDGIATDFVLGLVGVVKPE